MSAPTISEVKTRNADNLMLLPGVVSVGIGQNAIGGECIVISLKKSHAHMLKDLPKTLDGFEVRVDIVG